MNFGSTSSTAGLRLAAVLLATGLSFTSSAQPADRLDRRVLPIAEPKPPVYTEIDARKAKMPPRFEVKAPKGAPNVVMC